MLTHNDGKLSIDGEKISDIVGTFQRTNLPGIISFTQVCVSGLRLHRRQLHIVPFIVTRSEHNL